MGNVFGVVFKDGSLDVFGAVFGEESGSAVSAEADLQQDDQELSASAAAVIGGASAVDQDEDEAAAAAAGIIGAVGLAVEEDDDASGTGTVPASCSGAMLESGQSLLGIAALAITGGATLAQADQALIALAGEQGLVAVDGWLGGVRQPGYEFLAARAELWRRGHPAGGWIAV